jgi:UDP-N-acetylmuramate--alanine ligase
LCTDDAAVRDIVDDVTCPVTSYGLNEQAQVRAVNVRAVNGQMHFTVLRRNGITLPDMDVVLNLPGMHNVLNALSAIAVAVELNIPDAAVCKALAEFKGVGRRFQRYGDLPLPAGGVVTVIDDYGHHPAEMAATLAAALAVLAASNSASVISPLSHLLLAVIASLGRESFGYFFSKRGKTLSAI